MAYKNAVYNLGCDNVILWILIRLLSNNAGSNYLGAYHTEGEKKVLTGSDDVWKAGHAIFEGEYKR